MAASASDAHPFPIYNARFRFIAPLLDADGDLVTGASTPDSEISQDCGTFADATNEMTEIATNSGMYYLDLISTELDTKSTAVIMKSATAGMKTTPIVLYPKRLPVIRTGTAQAGGASSITLDSGASAIDDYYVGCYVNITNNTPSNALGQARLVTAYVGSTKVATVEGTYGTNPSSSSTFEVLSTELWIYRLGDTRAFGGVASAQSGGIPEVNTTKLAGTAQTGRDIGANVLLSSGTGTGQLDFTSGVVKANAVQWLGGTIPAVNVTGVPLVDLKYTLGTISPATAGSVRSDAVTGAVGSVTGAVGSVTARVTANTDQLAGQTVTAAAGVTFPTSVASPTNITAGTITTVTNLTNAPTNGDLTAAMKASVNAEADTALADYDAPTNAEMVARTLASASYATSAAQTTAQTSLDDIPTNAELATALDALPTAAENADAVWDEALAGHAVSGSTGEALSAAGSAGDPWLTALPGAYGSGTAGKIIGDNINATISSRATQTSVDDLPTNAELATALGTADDATLTAIGALSIPTTAQIADKILDRSLAGGADGGRTVQDALRTLRNKSEIAGGTLTVYEEDDTTPAWTAVATTAPGDPLTSIDPA